MIKRIVQFALQQPLFVLLGLLIFIGAGVTAFKNLPVEAFPDVTDTQVTIITLYPGRAAEEGFEDLFDGRTLTGWKPSAFDTQKLKEEYVYGLSGADEATIGRSAVMGALTLYLDFINLFMMLLQLFGQRGEE